MDKNQYIIPKSKIILEVLFTLTYFLIIVGLFIIPIILDSKKIIHLGTGLLFWSFLLIWGLSAISYFIFLKFWTNLFSSPVRKWALANIRCPECGNEFTKDESINLSFETLVMPCKSCKEVYFIKSEGFNRKLSFKKNTESDLYLDYKDKYFGKKLKVPLIVFILTFFIASLPFLLSVSIVLVPFILFIKFIGVSIEITYIFLLIFVLFFNSSSKFFYRLIAKSLIDYPLKKWLLKNNLCPQCNKQFIELEFLTSAKNKGKVYCGLCKKNHILEWGKPVLFK